MANFDSKEANLLLKKAKHMYFRVKNKMSWVADISEHIFIVKTTQNAHFQSKFLKI